MASKKRAKLRARAERKAAMAAGSAVSVPQIIESDGDALFSPEELARLNGHGDEYRDVRNECAQSDLSGEWEMVVRRVLIVRCRVGVTERGTPRYRTSRNYLRADLSQAEASKLFDALRPALEGEVVSVTYKVEESCDLTPKDVKDRIAEERRLRAEERRAARAQKNDSFDIRDAIIEVVTYEETEDVPEIETKAEIKEIQITEPIETEETANPQATWAEYAAFIREQVANGVAHYGTGKEARQQLREAFTLYVREENLRISLEEVFSMIDEELVKAEAKNRRKPNAA